MTKSITVPLIAKTPLWTGTTPKKMEFLKATSILGGLRFWTEALLRSLGHHVCAKQECLHDPDQSKKACALCDILGCTGLGRGFALKINDIEKPQFLQSRTIKFPHRNYPKKNKKNGKEVEIIVTPKFFLKPGIEEGFPFDFAISPLRPDVNMDPVLLSLHLMIHWGAMGAQDQYGYGYVAPKNKNGEDGLKTGAAKFALTEKSPAATSNDRATRPDLRDFFFFSGRIKQQDDSTFARITWNGDCPYPLAVPLELRCRVREILRDKYPQLKTTRHQFCGNVGGLDQYGSRYNMGLIGDNIYGWGWYPRQGNNNSDRDTCLEAVKTKLAEICDDSKWKEFSSSRDCESPKNWPEFLSQLRDTTWR